MQVEEQLVEQSFRHELKVIFTIGNFSGEEEQVIGVEHRLLPRFLAEFLQSPVSREMFVVFTLDQLDGVIRSLQEVTDEVLSKRVLIGVLFKRVLILLLEVVQQLLYLVIDKVFLCHNLKEVLLVGGGYVALMDQFTDFDILVWAS